MLCRYFLLIFLFLRLFHNFYLRGWTGIGKKVFNMRLFFPNVITGSLIFVSPDGFGQENYSKIYIWNFFS